MNYKENLWKHNEILSGFATLDKDVIYFKENNDNIRPPFYHDIDRIIYSLAFQRYSDKTQVFSTRENDHLQHRMIHVIYVSKIARTIGRALGLNEDLIEAAALGHDLGHTPFGHAGESILNKISLKNNEGYFNHNIQSIRVLMNIENFGSGLNISLQTLDSIMCHNGEIECIKYEPTKKDKSKFLEEYNDSYKDSKAILKLRPMTLEGCVVRISDLIAYLGRDIEDAIRMNLVTFDDIPKNIKEVLGTSNREIVNTLILDIIKNSLGKNYIKLSENVFEALKNLKKFNYENIYKKASPQEFLDELELMFNTLFDKYMSDLKTNNKDSNIINSYLENMSDEYKKNTNARIVIDYIAGMTDNYARLEYNKIINSRHNNGEVQDEI